MHCTNNSHTKSNKDESSRDKIRDTYQAEPALLLSVETVLADQELKCQGRSFSRGSEEQLPALKILSHKV